MTRITTSVNKPSPSTTTVKFLYSYNGKIFPRHTDASLRYIGGHTRVLAVNRSISYAELIVKFYEACGFSVTLKCKLPSEDLDVLVSVSSVEELAAVIEEYDRVSPEAKIRVVLCPVSSLKKVLPVPSVESLVEYSSVSKPKPLTYPRRQWRRECLPVVSRFGRDANPRNLLCGGGGNIQGLNKKQLLLGG
ncbi:RAF-like serine/threonine-protein kinase PRAF [Bidens hawaiensis]|uniref:RAF-like serine/threonine-protein kinase PRAF n=1 Tax=Bidens hawaiensis TaxID=980011 RepID=UPI00404A19DD